MVLFSMQPYINETQIIALNHNFNQFISHLFTAKNDDVELVEVVPLEKRNSTLGLDEYDDDYPPASFIPVAYFPFNIDFRSLFTGFDGKKLRLLEKMNSLSMKFQ